MRSLLLVAVLACAVYALAEGKPKDEKGDNSALAEIDNGNDFALASNDKISSSALEAWQEKLFSESESILGRRHRHRRRHRRSRRRHRRSRHRRSRSRHRRSRSRHRRRRQEHHEPKWECEGNECSCCLKVTIVEACFKVAHDGDNFDVTLTASAEEVFNKNVPFNDSEALCGSVDGIDICAEIYDASIENSEAHACLRVTEPISIDVSCFNMGSSIHPITQEVTNYITEDTDSGYHDDHDDNDEDGEDRLMEFEAVG